MNKTSLCKFCDEESIKNLTGEGIAALANCKLRSRETRGPVEKTPEPWPPITNGSSTTTHSATAPYPESGEQASIL
jgi:hypothetical protein